MDKVTLEIVEDEIRNGRAGLLAEAMEIKISRTPNELIKPAFLFYLGICYLQLGVTRKAISIINKSLQIDNNQGFAWFIKGVAYLWTDHEEKALEIWSECIPSISVLNQTTIIRNIIYNHNFREFIYKNKFNVMILIDFYRSSDNLMKICDSDVEFAYSQLKKNSLFPALSYFSLILKRQPDNYEALRGRGVVYALLKQWDNCIKDLDREFPPEYENEALKFCAIAMASVGDLFMSVMKITQVIENNPTDFEAIAVRGRVQMMRGCYDLAINDFNSIPVKYHTDEIIVNISECYYDMGQYYKGLKTLDTLKDGDSYRSLYSKFLCHSEMFYSEKGEQEIIEAAKLMPCFFIFRVAGDFMMNIGHYQKAVEYYELALKKKEDDAETKRLYAVSLMNTGNIIKGFKILEEMVVSWKKVEDSFDIGQSKIGDYETNGELFHFNRSQSANSVIRKVTEDLVWARKLMKVWKENFIFAVRFFPNLDAEVKCALNYIDLPENPKDDFVITDRIKTLIKDADFLGKRCFIKDSQVNSNRVVIRAYGLCTLYLANFIKVCRVYKEGSLKEALDAIRTILSLADMRNNVKIRDNTVSKDETPVYIIQDGERDRSRINIYSQLICEKIRHRYQFQYPNELIKPNTPENLFSAAQGDICYQYKTDRISNPTVSIKLRGTHGIQVSLTPAQPSTKMYNMSLDTVWKEMIKSNKTNELECLTTLLYVVWCVHPFTHYSPQLGYIIYNAYMLAVHESEVMILNNNQIEVHLNVMVKTDIASLREILGKNMGTKCKTICSKNSITYWNSLVKVSELVSILRYRIEE